MRFHLIRCGLFFTIANQNPSAKRQNKNLQANTFGEGVLTKAGNMSSELVHQMLVEL